MIDFRELIEFLKDTLAYIITVAVLAFIFIFIIALVPVAGNSMNPSINDGDLTVVLRMSYVFNGPKRGDIVNIKTNDKLRYVKRIIGLPGENVNYLNGTLYINDKAISEDYVEKENVTNNFMFEDICPKKECPDNVIPEDMYLVLGDNRDDSKDSRDSSIGLISIKEIKGRVALRVYPFSDIKVIN